jgi:DNA-binding ferritin-like protein (Dps family)
MTMGISDFASKVIGDKRRWKDYKARAKRLPPSYRTAVEALERYVMFFGPEDVESASRMFEDLVGLFEEAAADQAPIRVIVGSDPVEFVEMFLQNYSKGGWITRERERLASAIERAEGEEGGTSS